MTLQNGQANARRNAYWSRLSLVAMAVVFGILVSANVFLSFVFSGFFSGATLTDPQGNTMVTPTANGEVAVWLNPTSTAPTATEEAAPTARPTQAEEAAPTARPTQAEEPAPTAEPTRDTGANGMLPTLGSGPGGDVTSLRQYIVLGVLALGGFALLGTALLVRRRVSWHPGSS